MQLFPSSCRLGLTGRMVEAGHIKNSTLWTYVNQCFLYSDIETENRANDHHDIYIYIRIPWNSYCCIHFWLVFSTPLKNISQLGWLFPINGTIKNVPNHQLDFILINHFEESKKNTAADTVEALLCNRFSSGGADPGIICAGGLEVTQREPTGSQHFGGTFPVGGFSPTLWKIWVNWDDCSQSMEKLKVFQTTNHSLLLKSSSQFEISQIFVQESHHFEPVTHGERSYCVSLTGLKSTKA